MRSGKRTLLFKIVLTVTTSFVVIALTAKACHLYFDLQKGPGNDAYRLNDAINDAHKAKAQKNPYGFNEKIRTVNKPKGIFRIAVLGDSFVWGDGVPDEQIWSHKLEQKILKEYDSVEVMSWGKCGWNTLDEFNFYKEHGKDYNIDLLIIGWVDNDPDLGRLKQIARLNPENEYPLTWKIYPALARRLVNEREDNVYDPWMDSLYTETNLRLYQNLLDTMGVVFREQHLPVFFVLTPNGLDDQLKSKFEAVKPIMVHAGITYLDVLPGVIKNLGHYSALQLQANPVNPHPGPLLTEEYAVETLDYLKSQGYLKRSN